MKQAAGVEDIWWCFSFKILERDDQVDQSQVPGHQNPGVCQAAGHWATLLLDQGATPGNNITVQRQQKKYDTF